MSSHICQGPTLIPPWSDQSATAINRWGNASATPAGNVPGRSTYAPEELGRVGRGSAMPSGQTWPKPAAVAMRRWSIIAGPHATGRDESRQVSIHLTSGISIR
jgi:hypothetical protein